MRKVILDLLRAQLSESWSLCTFNSLNPKQVVSRGANNAYNMLAET